MERGEGVGGSAEQKQEEGGETKIGIEDGGSACVGAKGSA